MMSTTNEIMIEITSFKCDNCQVYFKRKEGLEKHLNKKFKCSPVSTDIPTVSTDIPTVSTDIPTVSTDIPTVSANNNEILEMKEILMVLVNEIRTLKEDVVNIKSICSVNTTTVPNPISTEKDKYIQQPTAEKDVVVSKQKKTKKPKITCVEDINKKQLERQFTPIIIPENLKSLKEKMIYINDTHEPKTNLFSNVTDFYKTNELFEFDDDTSKIYIRENKVDYLIGECSNKCKSKSFMTDLFRNFINQQTEPLFYYDGIHLFIVDEQCFFDQDIDHSVSNPIACKFLDTFNSILAYTAIREKDKQNNLFDIKCTNITSKVFNEIVVKNLTM